MFERMRRFRRNDETGREANGGGVATAERDRAANHDADYADGDGNGNGSHRARNGALAGGAAAATVDRPGRRHRGRDVAEGAALGAAGAEMHHRAHERFGGINWGAGFFGWLVALGIGVLLTAIVAAAGAAIGLTNGASSGTASKSADTISIVGGAVLLAIGLIAYYAGGYVAGRMSRFDGARQGVAAWIVGLLATLLVAGAGAIFGSQYNVFSKLNLPRIPIDEGSLTTGGAIFLAAFLVGTLVASILGGLVGRNYHRRVDIAAVKG